jgi:hypothetical protein
VNSHKCWKELNTMARDAVLSGTRAGCGLCRRSKMPREPSTRPGWMLAPECPERRCGGHLCDFSVVRHHRRCIVVASSALPSLLLS